jgi:hypothetical protein
MHINLSSDRLLHLLILIVSSTFFGFIVQYWTESGLLFSFSGGVTIAVQLSNVIEKFRNPPPEANAVAINEGKNDNLTKTEEECSGGNKRPNKKQLKTAQRRRVKTAVID